MSGRWKFLDKLQETFGAEPDSKDKSQIITFPDNNEKKWLTRSKSGRYKQFNKYRKPLNECDFQPLPTKEVIPSSGQPPTPNLKEEKRVRQAAVGSNVSNLKEMFEVKI